MAAAAPFRHVAFRHVSNPVRIHAGDNALDRLGEEADRAGARWALVVCGQTVAHRTNLLERVKQALGDRLAGVFEGVRAGSPATSVLQGVAQAATVAPDLIVAVGGGSAVVTARAITIMLAEGGTLHDHATKYPPGERPISPRLMQPKVPNIVVLTTPTTAAHRAGTAVTDAKGRFEFKSIRPGAYPAEEILEHFHYQIIAEGFHKQVARVFLDEDPELIKKKKKKERKKRKKAVKKVIKKGFLLVLPEEDDHGALRCTVDFFLVPK